MSVYVIAYDIGTTGVKTCLFNISPEEGIDLRAGEMADYGLYIVDGGGAEQDPEEWWQGMCSSTKNLLSASGVAPEDIRGISFCAQMQSLVLVDRKGVPLRRAMNYMDNRGWKQMERVMGSGLKVAGMNAHKLYRSIKISGAVSGSAKDPVWKYLWVKENEKDIFDKVYKWLDVKDFLVCRATGRFVMSRDSAFATLLYDTRPDRKRFSSELCRIMGVDTDHLPEICESADMAGGLTGEAAAELGLNQGTPVFSGGGDASLIGVGAGSVSPGDAHIYVGTSGWVSKVVREQKLSISTMTASIVGADPRSFNYFAELETAGKCLEWAKDHIGLDDMGIMGTLNDSADIEKKLKNIYGSIMDKISGIPAGSHGIIFTPWLHGNRCPFEDPDARGMFFGIGLETDTKDLIHAVIEGVCMHLRWQLESIEKDTGKSYAVRFVGGGALSSLTCRTLADVTGCRVETVENPQNAGAVGAAAVMALGLGIIDDIEDVKDLIRVKGVYEPDMGNKAVYDQLFPVFRDLYYNNKKAFKALKGRSR